MLSPMIAGANRYRRSLGFAGMGENPPTSASSPAAPALAAETPLERILGIDYKNESVGGGYGAQVDIAPSNFIALILGAGLGGLIAKNKVMGIIWGAAAGTALAVGAKAAGHHGW